MKLKQVAEKQLYLIGANWNFGQPKLGVELAPDQLRKNNLI